MNSQLINNVKMNNREIAAEYNEIQLLDLKDYYSKYESIIRKVKRVQAIAGYPKDKVKEMQLRSMIKRLNGENILAKRTGDQKIIVSITSYPKRLSKAPAAIMSMMMQTVKPDRVILWLGEDECKDYKLPPIFKKLCDAGLEIKYRKDLGVHTRWYYGIKENPNDVVIIMDDDIMYDNYIIEKLMESYKRNPNAVSALCFNRIRFNDDCSIKPYEEWITACRYKNKRLTNQIMAVEVGGTLYPPQALPEEAFNKEVFMTLSPKQDDIWLRIMEVINGTYVVPAQEESKVWGQVIRGTQRNLALGISNMAYGGNDKQLHDILNKYNQWYNEYTLEEIMAADIDVKKLTKRNS